MAKTVRVVDDSGSFRTVVKLALPKARHEAVEEFLAEYVSEKAMGDEGYLDERGLVPQPKSDLAKTRADVKALKTFTP